MTASVNAGTDRQSRKMKIDIPVPARITSGYFGYSITKKPNKLKLYAIFIVS